MQIEARAVVSDEDYLQSQRRKQMEREHEIQVIAYKLWEDEGCVDGLDCEQWYRAEVIWEQKRKEPVAENTKTQSEQLVEQNTAIPGKKRRSKAKYLRTER
jgi:hypothetical protein